MTTLEAVVALPGVDEYMAEVEGRLAVAVGSHGGRVAAVGADALAAGGKRLRPLLAFLSAPPNTPAPVAAGVAVELVHMFDAAGLFVHADDDHWAKLAVEVTAAGPTIVSVVTDTFSDDCNSTVLAQSSAWLRLARVGEAIAFHASDGGGRWELVRVFRPVSAAVRIGFICQAPTGAGCTGSFDGIAFNPRSLGDIRDGT